MKRIQYDYVGNAYLINEKDMEDFNSLCQKMFDNDEKAMSTFVEKYGKFMYVCKEDQLLGNE